jgi:hypothetical protein
MNDDLDQCQYTCTTLLRWGWYGFRGYYFLNYSLVKLEIATEFKCSFTSIIIVNKTTFLKFLEELMFQMIQI